MKAHFPTLPDDLLPDDDNHLSQDVGADVGLCGGEDLLWCAMRHKFLQHGAAEAVVDAGHQLAVRKGACPAFAKLDIGTFIQPVLHQEVIDIKHPLLHRRALLQKDRTIAGSCKGKSRKHSRRARADDDRAMPQLFGSRCKARFFLPKQASCGARRKHDPVLQRGGYGVIEQDMVLFACIHAFTVDIHRQKVPAFAAQCIHDLPPEIGLRIQWYYDIVDKIDTHTFSPNENSALPIASRAELSVI